MKNKLNDVALRAIKTTFQTAASMITVGTLFTEVDWVVVFSVSAVAGIYSVLTNIVTLLDEEGY